MGIGFKELLIILVIAMLMFGTKKIRGIGGDVGGWIRDFKKALKDGEQEANQEAIAARNAEPGNGTVIDSGQASASDKKTV